MYTTTLQGHTFCVCYTLQDRKSENNKYFMVYIYVCNYIKMFEHYKNLTNSKLKDYI